jgi:threonine aldolase
LIGEAIVINNNNIKEDFGYHLKQRGALIGKGRIFGVQFVELFKSDLYFELARHANHMAMKMTKAIKEAGFSFFIDSTSNQIFPILPDKLIDKLSTKYGFYTWQKMDESNSAIRLVTSWATREESVNQFIEDLTKM